MLAILSLVTALGPLLMSTRAMAETRRVAIVVGSNVGQGERPALHYAEADAEKLARSAAALAAQTDLLSEHADTLLDLAHVLAAAARFPEAHDIATQAFGLYQRKGNLPGSRESYRYLTQYAPA